MLSYLKFYIVKDDKIQSEKVFIKDPKAKNILIQFIEQIFNAIDAKLLANDLLSWLDKTNYTAFDIFKHVCEFHLFEVVKGQIDLTFAELQQIYDPKYVLRFTILPDQSDDDDDDY